MIVKPSASFSVQSADPQSTSAAKTILVVDREIASRTVAIKALRDARFEVIGAAGAGEAMAVLGGALQIDLVLTDSKLRGSVTGIGLARFARRSRPQIKVVFLTKDAADAALRPWGNGFLSKPCGADLLVKTLRNVLAVD